ncbi:MAG: hypothetical protein JSU59_04400, partial [Nitrospirota bacterium]
MSSKGGKSKKIKASASTPAKSKTPAKQAGPDIEASEGRRMHITDVALRDGHQSLLATRMRTE